MNKVITTYKGVVIIESEEGYFYPDVDGDIECSNVDQVKEWVDEIYIPYKESLTETFSKPRIPFELFCFCFYQYN